MSVEGLDFYCAAGWLISFVMLTVLIYVNHRANYATERADYYKARSHTLARQLRTCTTELNDCRVRKSPAFSEPWKEPDHPSTII